MPQQICVRCQRSKSVEAFDTSPRTGRIYTCCKQCRNGKYSPFNKRRCAECKIMFMPKELYQKTCNLHCCILWQMHRNILRESGYITFDSGNHTILIDADDYEWAIFYTWHICSSTTTKSTISYPYHNETWLSSQYKGGKIMKMSNQIMEVGYDLVVDHINHNGLDNRKDNLRICTRKQNQQNIRKSANRSSIYKGVTWNKQSRKWRAYIAYDQKYHHLGVFDSEIEAARAYNTAATTHYGEFACINYPSPS